MKQGGEKDSKKATLNKASVISGTISHSLKCLHLEPRRSRNRERGKDYLKN